MERRVSAAVLGVVGVVVLVLGWDRYNYCQQWGAWRCSGTDSFTAMLVMIAGGLLLLTTLFLVVARPASPAAAPPPSPGCPRCGRPMRWIPAYSTWYCDSCRAYAAR